MGINKEELDKIRIICSVESIRFKKNDFGIIEVSIDKIKSGKPISDGFGRIIVKGSMPTPVIGNQYDIYAQLIHDPKYGDQYNIISMVNSLDLDLNDHAGQKKFLLSLFTPIQIEEMYKVIDSPFEVLKNKDYDKLVQVKGCGLLNAQKWVERFNKSLYRAKIYIELEGYELTNNMIDRLLDKYKSPDLVIEKIKSNPYTLIEIEGIGWKTADKIALDGGLDLYGKERVEAFIKFYLSSVGINGYSWITPDELLGAVLDNLGEEVKDETIVEVLKNLYVNEDIYWNDDKTKIGLRRYYNLELNIAKELIRIRDASSSFSYDNWEECIGRLEKKQGWKYSEKQINGVKEVLDNNVCVVYGEAGSGKTTLVSAMLESLKEYSYAQTSLAGRAASRMSEVTGNEGFTIHRLLGYPSIDEKNKQGFTYHDENQLDYDIIILDEISMVDAYLFYDLIRAIKSGSKLIMLGDIAQLESIGCGNVAYDMISSPEIPTVYLSEIFRQAASSAIITESRKARKGEQIVDKNWVGEETRGELQDLTIIGYSDRSNTYYKIMQRFSLRLEEFKNILEVQIIVPMKERGDASTRNINNAIQELYNPLTKSKKEVTVMYNGRTGILREGDKVINVKNNYKTRKPIYNGNIGILREIFINEDGDEMLKIDFMGIGEIDIEYKDFNKIELGYAITVHKEQGSQADCIIFGLDFSSYPLLSRELIYTGITRAKKKTDLIAETSALRLACSKEGVSKKQTYLQDCLNEIAHPKLVF